MAFCFYNPQRFIGPLCFFAGTLLADSSLVMLAARIDKFIRGKAKMALDSFCFI